MRIQEFSPSTSLLLHRASQLFLGIPPFISDPGSGYLCLLHTYITKEGHGYRLHAWISGKNFDPKFYSNTFMTFYYYQTKPIVI